MPKSMVFIDGGYLRKVLKDVFREPRIDLECFSNKVCGDAERIRTYYYCCKPYLSKPPTQDERKMYADFEKFLYKLERLNRFEVRLGRLQKIGNVYKQKLVDVLLSVDLVRMSYRGRIDKAILVTGDSDFEPAVKAAKDAGIVVIIYYSRAPPAYAHDKLLSACDECYEITQDLIDQCTISET